MGRRRSRIRRARRTRPSRPACKACSTRASSMPTARALGFRARRAQARDLAAEPRSRLLGPVRSRPTIATSIRSWRASKASSRTATGPGKPIIRAARRPRRTSTTTLPSIQRWQTLVAAPNFGQNATIVSSIGGNYQMTCTTGLPIYYGTTESASQNCYDAIVGRYKSITSVSQDIMEATSQGKLADMRSGRAPVRRRRQPTARTVSSTSPINPQASIYDAPLGLFVSNPTQGETEVSEIYGEVLVPVTERLDLDSATGTRTTTPLRTKSAPTRCLVHLRCDRMHANPRGGYKRRAVRRTRPSCSRPRPRCSRPPSRAAIRAA